jgi:hypothetical protein
VFVCCLSCKDGLHIPPKDAAAIDGFVPDAAAKSDAAGGTAGTDGIPTGGAGGNSLCDPRGGSPGEQWSCGSVTFATTRRPTDVLLVLDRSGSMKKSVVEDCFCAVHEGDESGRLCSDTSVCTDRWVVLKTAVEKLIAEAPGIEWGMQLFPSSEPSSCGVSFSPEVVPSPSGGAAARAQIATLTPGGSTPVAMAIGAAAFYLGALAAPNPKAILLATDGEANCTDGHPDTTSSVLDATLAAIATAQRAGFPVYVVGVGPGTDDLDRMAKAGGTGVYHPATSPEELLTDLASISRTVAGCTLPLPKAPPAPENIAVYVDNQLVKEDPANGWSYGADTSSLVFSGTYCERLVSASDVTVKVLFGCSSSASFPPCIL